MVHTSSQTRAASTRLAAATRYVGLEGTSDGKRHAGPVIGDYRQGASIRGVSGCLGCDEMEAGVGAGADARVVEEFYLITSGRAAGGPGADGAQTVDAPRW